MREGLLVYFMKSTISLDQKMRTALQEAAVKAALEGVDKLSLKTASIEGVVRKEKEYLAFMGDGGPLFSAEIETDRGRGRASFILTDRYLRDRASGVNRETFSFELNEDRAAKASWN